MGAEMRHRKIARGLWLPVVLQKESAKRDRSTWPTLSKPQIYDVGGEARENLSSRGSSEDG